MRAVLKPFLRSFGLLPWARNVRASGQSVRKSIGRRLYREHHIRIHDAEITFPLFNNTIYHWFARYKGRAYNWHEPSITKVVYALSQNHHTFVDIGAHIGYFSFVFANAPNTVAYALELHPTIAQHLETMKNRIRGIQGRVEVHNMGISDAPSHAEIPVATTSKLASLENRGRESASTQSVPITTLDAFCRETNIVPEVVKIDIEGHEWEALNGAKETIANAKPILIMEIHKHFLARKGHRESEIIDWLKAQHYRIYSFSDHRTDVPQDPTPFSAPPARQDFAILCYPVTDG